MTDRPGLPGMFTVHLDQPDHNLTEPDRYVGLRVENAGRELIAVRVPVDVARAGLPAQAVDLVAALIRDVVPIWQPDRAV